MPPSAIVISNPPPSSGIFGRRVKSAAPVGGLPLAIAPGESVCVLAECERERRSLAQRATDVEGTSAALVGGDPFGAFRRGTKLAYQFGQISADARDAALRGVGLSFECGWRYPHEFGAGQLQRLALARALAASPALLVCDDPLRDLDPLSAQRFLNCLADATARRPELALLFPAGSPERLPTHGDRYYHLAQQRLTEMSAPVPAAGFRPVPA